MPKLATPLTDIQPRTAKPREKPYKLTDGGGLHLLIKPDGAKYWRMGYRFGGVERTLAFGKYPDISLADARKARSAARAKINAGIDPSQAKRIDKINQASSNANTLRNNSRNQSRESLRDFQNPSGLQRKAPDVTIGMVILKSRREQPIAKDA
jgi:hypothetical protein